MNAKKLMIAGLAVTLLNTPFLQNADTAFAKGQPASKTQTAHYKYELSSKQAMQVAALFAKSASYVQAGGSYKTGEYKTFSYKGKTYRYLSSAIDTKKELMAYLQKSLTSAAAEQFIKAHGIISYKGKLAQVKADGGSLLQWNKATAEYVKTNKNTKIYRVTVPVGDTKEKAIYLVEYQYAAKVGWRISKEPYKDPYTAINSKLATDLASIFARSASYVQVGGHHGPGEYKTFRYKAKTYRYLSKPIDTKKELLSYLQKSLTQSAAEQFIKSRGIIEYKGKLAQIEADGGSMLQWAKAAAEMVKDDKNKKIYRLIVPVGETNEKEAYLVEYQYADNIGWKISKEPTRDHYSENISNQAVYRAAEFAKASSYVQAGGAHKPGEYKTFVYNGKTYRYLSGDIDSKKELMVYLMNTLTYSAAEQFFKKSGIIEYNGKLAQLEADGGSLLQWNKATAALMKTEKNTKFYRLTVPVGETSEKAVFIVEYQYVNNIGWRISKEPYRDLDIPGNMNPAFIFFKYLLVNSKVSQEQFIYPDSFNVEQFKKGIKKLEIREVKERTRNSLQAEYTATFYVELESGYKGTLKNGNNQMFFVIQPTGEMVFKIAAAKDMPSL
ncbi:DL-endopeptidase inhibitor IseA family protein [Peribacillus saganii]|nr:DL-endopeptidase inhibitor IseA family protein [Peribacillus saganii]